MSNPSETTTGVRELLEQAKKAARAGEHARARALLEQLLDVIDPADANGRSVALSGLASALAAEGHHEQAIERWEHALRLCDEIGDERGRSLTLDKMASLWADLGDWHRARAAWEQALESDTRLGNARDRAATLGSLAQAVARTGDPERAGMLWAEALAFYDESGDARGAASILRVMAAAAIGMNDWRDPIHLRQRGLAICERYQEVRGMAYALDGLGHEAFQRNDPSLALSCWERARAAAERLGDRLWASVLLAGTACCKDALGETASALELWSRALLELDDLDGEPQRRDVIRAMQSARVRSGQPTPRVKFTTLSEYDLQPGVALFFGVGEALAALHALHRRIGGLSRGDLGVGASGLVRLSPAAKLPFFHDFGPEVAAHDLGALLDRYPPDHAGAVLAGYVRGASELLEGSHSGYTAALLERLAIPEPWPRSADGPVDITETLGALGAELRVAEGSVAIHVRETDTALEIWRRAPYDAFQVVLALLIVGVDCRRLFERDGRGRGPVSELYQVLFPDQPPVVDAEADVRRLVALAPGLEIVLGLARVLRNQHLSEPLQFRDVIEWVHRAFYEGAGAQTLRFGDIVLDAAHRCARLASDPRAQRDFTQRGMIVLGYVSRGRRTDEGRLIAAARSLYELPGYPKPWQPWNEQPDFSIWNSWLITLRELASKSAAEEQRGRPGMLRSAVVRGLALARHGLLRSFEMASSRDPEVATTGFALLRTTVKNHANLLLVLARSGEHEQKSKGTSAWLSLFWLTSSPCHLGAELAWMGRFFNAAAREGFTLDEARSFMREGRVFLSAEGIFSTLPPTREALT